MTTKSGTVIEIKEGRATIKIGAVEAGGGAEAAASEAVEAGAASGDENEVIELGRLRNKKDEQKRVILRSIHRAELKKSSTEDSVLVAATKKIGKRFLQLLNLLLEKELDVDFPNDDEVYKAIRSRINQVRILDNARLVLDKASTPFFVEGEGGGVEQNDEIKMLESKRKRLVDGLMKEVNSSGNLMSDRIVAYIDELSVILEEYEQQMYETSSRSGLGLQASMPDEDTFNRVQRGLPGVQKWLLGDEGEFEELRFKQNSFFMDALYAFAPEWYRDESVSAFDMTDFSEFPSDVELLHIWGRNPEIYRGKVDKMFELLKMVTHKEFEGADYTRRVNLLANYMYPGLPGVEEFEDFLKDCSIRVFDPSHEDDPAVAGAAPEESTEERTAAEEAESDALLGLPNSLKFDDKFKKTLGLSKFEPGSKKKARGMRKLMDLKLLNGGFPKPESISPSSHPKDYTKEWKVTAIRSRTTGNPKISRYEDIVVDFDGHESLPFHYSMFENRSFLIMLDRIGPKDPAPAAEDAAPVLTPSFQSEIWALWRRLCIFPKLKIETGSSDVGEEFVYDVATALVLLPIPDLELETTETFKMKIAGLVAQWDGIFDWDSIFKASIFVVRAFLDKYSDSQSMLVEDDDDGQGPPRIVGRKTPREGDGTGNESKRGPAAGGGTKTRREAGSPSPGNAKKKASQGEYLTPKSLAVI